MKGCIPAWEHAGMHLLGPGLLPNPVVLVVIGLSGASPGEKRGCGCTDLSPLNSEPYESTEAFGDMSAVQSTGIDCGDPLPP